MISFLCRPAEYSVHVVLKKKENSQIRSELHLEHVCNNTVSASGSACFLVLKETHLFYFIFLAFFCLSEVHV